MPACSRRASHLSPPPDLMTEPSPPSWPWDAWLATARNRGVPEELALLARDVLRDHAQHGREATWIGSDPVHLLDLCLQAPISARYQCVEALTWWNSSEDGGIAAFADIAQLLGSFEAGEAALEREAPTVSLLQEASRDRLN
jgi:hypothetical protein